MTAAEAKAQARRIAAQARDRWRSQPHITDHGLIAGRTEPKRCAGCDGTLSSLDDTHHPGCQENQ